MKKVFLSAVILLVTASPLFAAERAELKDVVAALEEGYRSLRDVEAHFTQRARVAGIPKEQKGEGEMALKKGESAAMFRFDYTKPQPQQIVYDGKKVWLYQPESRQVIQGNAESLLQGESGLALSYLTGLGSVSRDFTITFAGERTSEGNYRLELVPKKGGRLLAKLRITVSGTAVEGYLREGAVQDPFPLVASEVVDVQGNRTEMRFSRVRANRGIGSARFHFKTPKGVQVIQNP